MLPFIRASLILTLFLVPLIPAVGSYGYEHIKVIFFLILTFTAGFLWMAAFLKESTVHRFEWTYVKRFSLLFVVILLVTSFMGINPQNSIFGSSPYFQGLILYSFLLLFSWLISFSKLTLEQISLALVVSSSIVAFLAVKDWVLVNFFAVNIPTYAGRVVSTFGQPNLYSGFILLSLPFYRFLVSQNKNKAIWIYLAGVLAGLGILLSYSRAAILIGTILLGVWIMILLKKRVEKILFGLLVFLLILFVSVYLDFPSKVEKELSLGNYATPGWFDNYSPQRRIYIWPVILDLIAQKPLTGYGLDNLSSVFTSNIRVEEAKTLQAADLKNLVVDRSHNYILDLLVFSGVLGLFSWILLVGLLLKRARPKVLLVSLLIYLIWIQFQIQSVVHLIYFWLLVGLIDEQGDA